MGNVKSRRAVNFIFDKYSNRSIILIKVLKVIWEIHRIRRIG